MLFRSGGLSNDLEIKDHTSSVYNYHIGAIINNINEIHEVDENSNYEEDDVISIPV